MTTQAMDLVKRNVKLHISTSSSLYHTRQRLCRMHLNEGDEGGSVKVCKRKRRSQGTRSKFFQALPGALYIIKQSRKELSRRSSSESLSVTKGTKKIIPPSSDNCFRSHIIGLKASPDGIAFFADLQRTFYNN